MQQKSASRPEHPPLVLIRCKGCRQLVWRGVLCVLVRVDVLVVRRRARCACRRAPYASVYSLRVGVLLVRRCTRRASACLLCVGVLLVRRCTRCACRRAPCASVCSLCLGVLGVCRCARCSTARWRWRPRWQCGRRRRGAPPSCVRNLVREVELLSGGAGGGGGVASAHGDRGARPSREFEALAVG